MLCYGSVSVLLYVSLSAHMTCLRLDEWEEEQIKEAWIILTVRSTWETVDLSAKMN